MLKNKAVLIQKYDSNPDPDIWGYILLIFKAVPTQYSLANTPDIQYHEAVS